MDLVDDVYRIVLTFPKYEMFGLAAQMRGSSSSIPCNIAEGHGRFSLRDFRHFLRDARASSYELETQIIIAVRQHYITPATADDLTTKCVRTTQLINGLTRHLTRRLRDGERPTPNGERTRRSPS